jgi:hypothetical protein
MDRDTLIRKIKACLALSRSAEPHEAAAAMRQAQKLTEQLGITERELQMADVKEATVRATAYQVQVWEARLVKLVAGAMGCETFLSSRTVRVDSYHRPWQDVTDIVFVGVAPAHDLAAYAMEVLYRQCRTQRLAHVRKQPKACKPATKKARGDAFALGWVNGVRGLVQRLARTERHAELLLDYIAQQHPKMGDAKLGRRDAGRNVRSTDYASGHAAGERARLHEGVGAAGAPLMLGER